MRLSSLLVIFARAPEPGRVKTRLIPAVGAHGASSLHEAFIDDVCALTRGLSDLRLLAVFGDPAHPHLAAIARREGIECVTQAAGDLGAKMHAAIESGLARAERVAIIGADSPVLSPSHIASALAVLDDHDVVLGPADDGGYWLVGARRPVPWLFHDMTWSTPQVFVESVRRLRARGASHDLAAPFWDVDEPADLERLRAALALDPTVAPATRAALLRLGR